MAKASTRARGYGAAHQAERRRLEPIVALGLTDCWRCGERIEIGAPWDLGHDDQDRSKYRGPEHRRCNRATKGRQPNGLPSLRTGSGGRGAERPCEVCALAYRPSYSGQRTCGRACGVELRRRNKPSRSIPPKPAPQCLDCAHPIKQGKRCKNCSTERHRQHMRNLYRESVGIPLDAPPYTRIKAA